jgi:sugar/nucleoside kinase (ribokinase family)
VTFISPDGERSFAVASGVIPTGRPEQVVAQAACVVTTLYTLANPEWPIAAATRRVLEIADRHGVPVAFGLGTAGLVARERDLVIDVLDR